MYVTNRGDDMDPVAVIVLLVLMFTVAAVLVAVEDGRVQRRETTRSAASRAADFHERR